MKASTVAPLFSSPLSITAFHKFAILHSLSFPLLSKFPLLSVSSSVPSLIPQNLTAIPVTTRFSAAKAAAGSEADSACVGTERLVQHLVVKESDLRLLLDIEKRIFEGEDLSDLATEYSICESKKNGGMIGWVRRGQLVTEIEEAAFNNPLSKIVRCKTQIGWHLVQALSEREERLLKNIKPAELYIKLKDPGFLEQAQLIDVREHNEVGQASLPGFDVLPLSQFGSWGPEITSKLDMEKETYVLCHYGLRSLQIGKWLREQGFKRVFIVKGGIYEYAISADPSVPTY